MPVLLLHWRWKCFCFHGCYQDWYEHPNAALTRADISLAAALNYPQSRGTATSFPLAAFGLSAFLFSTIGTFALRDDTSKLLLLLATGTFLFPMVSFPFLRVYPQQLYDRLSAHDHDSQALHRTSSAESRRRRFSDTIGAQSTISIPLTDSEEDLKIRLEDDSPTGLSGGDHESSSLISKSSAGDLPSRGVVDVPDADHDSPHIDIRGFALLPHAEFWQLFLMLGLMTGIGLMTIK